MRHRLTIGKGEVTKLLQFICYLWKEEHLDSTKVHSQQGCRSGSHWGGVSLSCFNTHRTVSGPLQGHFSDLTNLR